MARSHGEGRGPAGSSALAPPDEVEPDDPAVLRYAWRTVSVVGLASLFSGMSTSALNVALPTVARSLDASATASTWMLLAFMLTQTVLMITFGRLADMFGRRTLYLAGLATFTVGSLAAGLAPTAWALVGFRVLQAAGSAMLLANSAALITDAFPSRRLGQGMGVYLASFSVAQLVGPTVGGVLAEHAGWRWVFWFNVPVGVCCLIWGAVSLRRVPRADMGQSVDLPGNVLVVVALASGLIALSQATTLGWSNPWILTGVAVFVVLLPLFVLLERHRAHPLVDTALFQDRTVAFGLLASFFNSVSQIGTVLLVGLYFQVVGGESPLAAGLHVLPLTVAALTMSSTSGLLQLRFPPRTLTICGNLLTASGLLVLMLSVSAEVRYGRIAVGLVLVGMGSGLFMPSNTTAVLRRLPSSRLGIANALRLMLQNTGIVLGTAVILTVLTSPLPPSMRRYVFAGTLSDVSDRGLQLLVTGYHTTLLTMLGIAACTTLASVSARVTERGGGADLESARGATTSSRSAG